MSDDGQKTVENGDGSQNAGEGGKIEFSPEQQSYVDTLINKKYGDAYTKIEAKYQEKMSGLESRITELSDKGGDSKDKKGAQGGEDLTALKDRLALMEEESKKSQELDRKSKILSAVAGLNTINSEHVATLMESSVRRNDDGTLVIINSDGAVRSNDTGNYMTIPERAAEFVAQNPHLAKAGGGTGAGSQGASFDGGGGGVRLRTVEDVQSMSIEDLKKQVAQGIDIPVGGGRSMKFKSQGDIFKI